VLGIATPYGDKVLAPLRGWATASHVLDRPGEARGAAGYTSSHTNPLSQTRRVPTIMAACRRSAVCGGSNYVSAWQTGEPEPWAYW